jgi:hypothetical protein
MRATHA